MKEGGKISAIVPTWNEAAWLPTLLQRLSSLAAVTEVVVADNCSADGTVEIARAGRCKVVAGGVPAVGRNTGARYAREELLLFVDADVAVTEEVINAIQDEFALPNRTLVHFRLVPATERRLVRFCYRIVDLYARLCHRLRRPQGSAPLICVRRSAFEAVGGFDEEVHVAEDVMLIRRVGRRFGGVAYVRDVPLQVSARRFEVESTFMYGLKCVMWGLLRAFGSRASLRRYSWKPYPVEVSSRDEVVVDCPAPVETMMVPEALR